jgi:hypothetical protein
MALLVFGIGAEADSMLAKKGMHMMSELGGVVF